MSDPRCRTGTPIRVATAGREGKPHIIRNLPVPDLRLGGCAMQLATNRQTEQTYLDESPEFLYSARSGLVLEGAQSPL